MDKKVYQLLKDYGHSAFKAAEIALDYARGDQHAIDWVTAIRASVPALSPVEVVS